MIPEEVELHAPEASRLDAFELDRRMREIARAFQTIDWRTGRFLELLSRNRLEGEVGFGSFEDYVRERLGISLRKARALVSLAKLAGGPVAEAYHAGRISWVRATILLALVRNAASVAIAPWVEHARRVTVRRLSDDVERAMEACAAGSGSGIPEPPPLDGSSSEAGGVQMRGDAALPRDACGRSFRIDFSAPASVAALFRQAIVAWSEPDEPLERGLARLLQHVVTEWRRLAQRSQNEILARDRWRCLVPACSSRGNLQVHHFVFRSAGGGDEPGNLGGTCVAHHLRGIHAGRIRARGEAPDAIAWELGVRPGREPLLRLRGDVYVEECGP